MKKLFLSLSILLLSACVPRILKPISLLADTVPFHVDPQNKDVLLYHNKNLKAQSYSKFLIDPVKIYSNESGGIRPEEEARLSAGFRNELIQSLQDGYRIVDEAGPGVLRIRTAILDIQPAHLELDEDRFIILRVDTLLARVSMELECVDSLSGERVAALIHTLHDRKYMEKEKKTRLMNIQEAFGAWAKSLRERLDRAKTSPRNPFQGFDPEDNRRLKMEEGD